MSSVCSAMSTMSVSFRGEEVELEKAVDKVFLDLQQNLNCSHSDMRSILMSDEQDAEYSTVVDLCLHIHNNIDGMVVLFKDLQSLLKQVSKPQDAEEKECYKAKMDKYKEDKKNKTTAV